MEKVYPPLTHSNTRNQPSEFSPKESSREAFTPIRNLYGKVAFPVSFSFENFISPVMKTFTRNLTIMHGGIARRMASVAILLFLGLSINTAFGQVNAIDDSYTVNSERKKWLDVYDNDTYPGAFTVTIVSPPANGIAKVLASGDIIYRSDFGYVGADLLSYEICSGGNCDQAFVSITNVVEICGNGLDDDGDGLTDAQDPDCVNEVDIACEDKRFFEVYGIGILNQSSYTLPVNDTANIDSMIAEVTYKGGFMSNVVFSTPNETQNITSFTPIENGSSSTAVFRAALDPATSVTVQPSNPSIAQSMMLYILRNNSQDCEGSGATLLPGYGYRSTIIRYANLPVTQQNKTVEAVVPCSEISLDGRILVVELRCAGQIARDTISTERDGSSLTISYLSLPNIPGSADMAELQIISPVTPAGQSVVVGSIKVAATCGNDCPITAVNDTFYTDPGVAVGAPVLINDLIPANNLDTSLTQEVVGPANGSLVNNGDGTFTYTPNPGFEGLDSFDYQIGNIAFPVYYDTARVYIVSRPITDTIVDTILVNTIYDSCINGTVFSPYGPYHLTSCSDPDSGTVSYNDTCGAGDNLLVMTGNTVTSVTNILSNNTGGTVSAAYTVPNGGDIISASVNFRLRGDFSNGPGGGEFANFSIDGSSVANNLSTGVDGCVLTSVGASNIDITSELQGNSSVNLQLFLGGQVNFVPGGACTNYGQIEVTIDVVLPGDTASSSPNYRVVYAPDSNYTGADTFCSITCDEFPICDTTIIVIVTLPPNSPPVAIDDSTSTGINTPVTIDVLANDSDPDGNLDPSSLNQLTNPTQGTVNQVGNQFVYTPDSGVDGTDLFTYEICDLGTPIYCDTATVFINVTVEICDNLIDDDNDGLIDCADSIDCKPVIDSIDASTAFPCVNDTVTYTVVNSDPIDNYQWAVPPTHIILESGSTTYFGPLSTITVVTGFASGDVCVYGFSPAGCDSDLICRPITVNNPPGSPAAIYKK